MSYSLNSPWYYAVEGERQGPIAFTELQQKFEVSELHADTLVWTQGMADWLPARQIAELAAVLAPVDACVPSLAGRSAALDGDQFSQARAGWNLAPRRTGAGRLVPAVKPANFQLWIGISAASLVFYMIGLGLTAANGDVTAFASVMIIAGLAAIIASTVMGSIFIYRAWLVLQDDQIPPRTTPGKAIGFLFIPFFSIYWMFVAIHGWSQDYKRLVSVYEYTDAPKIPENLFLAFPILVVASIIPGVGVLASVAMIVVGPVVFYHLCRVINYFAAMNESQGG